MVVIASRCQSYEPGQQLTRATWSATPLTSTTTLTNTTLTHYDIWSQLPPPVDTMGWPYAFIDLSDEEKAIRRQSLDFYAAVAHYSALIPILAVLLSHLIQRAVQSRRKGANGADYQQLPHSPVVKAARLSGRDGIGAVWRRLQWWMGDDVYFAGGHWGQKDQWVIGSIWMVWLLVLCVLGTGRGQFSFILLHLVSFEYLNYTHHSSPIYN